MCLEDVSDPLLTPKEKKQHGRLRKNGSFVIYYQYLKAIESQEVTDLGTTTNELATPTPGKFNLR